MASPFDILSGQLPVELLNALNERTNDGPVESNKIALTESDVDPSAETNKGVLYVKDVGGVSQLFYIDDAGVITQVTSGAPFNLDVKGSVRVQPTADFSTYTSDGSGYGKTLTAPSNSTTHNTQDNVLLAVGNRVLVTTAGGSVTTPDSDNGIYVVTTLGNGSTTSFKLTRAADFDQDTDATAGVFVFVTEGDTWRDTGWVLTTNDTITLDTTALLFAQFSTLPLGLVGDIIAETAGATAAAGTSGRVARADHVHALDAGLVADVAAETAGATAAAGVSTKVARADHVHALAAGTPVDASGTTNSDGVATTVARSDHAHRTLIQGLEEGSVVASRPALNFIGTNVTVADNVVDDRLDVTVTGGGGGNPDFITPTIYSPTAYFEQQVYVDPSAGDDDNDGLTELTPLKTLPGVYRKWPMSQFQNPVIYVNLAGIGGFGTNATGQRNYTDTAILVGGGGVFHGGYHYVGPWKTPDPTIVGSNAPVLDGTTPVEDIAAGQTRFNFSPSPGWSVNGLRARWIRVTRAGVPQLFELPIASNTANTLTVDTAYITGFILPTDEVQIVRQSVNMTGADGTVYISSPLNVPYQSGLGRLMSVELSYSTFDNIRFNNAIITNGTGYSFDGCRFSGGLVGPLGGSMCFNNCSNSGTVLIQGPSFAAAGYCVPKNYYTVASSFALVSLTAAPGNILHQGGGGIFIWHANVSAYGATATTVPPGSNGFAWRPGGWYPGSGFNVRGNCVVAIAHSGHHEFEVHLMGSGNVGAGITCEMGGQLKIGTTTPFTTITGTEGDIIVDGDEGFTAVSYADFNALWSGQIHRMGDSTGTVAKGSGARVAIHAPWENV